MTTQLKAGDEVFFHIVQNEANESLVAATVLRVLNNSDVQIKFAVPNEGGETTDTVNLSDLSLALGLDENKAEKKYSTPRSIAYGGGGLSSRAIRKARHWLEK